MGKTTVPMRLLVHPSIDGEAFDALRAKGHTVDIGELDYDLILGPNAQRMTPELVSLLDVTLTRVRREKRETKR